MYQQNNSNQYQGQANQYQNGGYPNQQQQMQMMKQQQMRQQQAAQHQQMQQQQAQQQQAQQQQAQQQQAQKPQPQNQVPNQSNNPNPNPFELDPKYREENKQRIQNVISSSQSLSLQKSKVADWENLLYSRATSKDNYDQLIDALIKKLMNGGGQGGQIKGEATQQAPAQTSQAAKAAQSAPTAQQANTSETAWRNNNETNVTPNSTNPTNELIKQEYNEELQKCRIYLPILMKMITNIKEHTTNKVKIGKIKNLHDNLNQTSFENQLMNIKNLRLTKETLEQWNKVDKDGGAYNNDGSGSRNGSMGGLNNSNCKLNNTRDNLTHEDRIGELHDKNMLESCYLASYRNFLQISRRDGDLQLAESIKKEQKQHAIKLIDLGAGDICDSFMETLFFLQQRSPRFNNTTAQIFSTPLMVINPADHHIASESILTHHVHDHSLHGLSQYSQALKMAGYNVMKNRCDDCGKRLDREILKEEVKTEVYDYLPQNGSSGATASNSNKRSSDLDLSQHAPPTKIPDTREQDIWNSEPFTKIKKLSPSSFCNCDQPFPEPYIGRPLIPDMLIGEISKLPFKFFVELDEKCFFKKEDNILDMEILQKAEFKKSLIFNCRLRSPFESNKTGRFDPENSYKNFQDSLPNLVFNFTINYPSVSPAINFDNWYEDQDEIKSKINSDIVNDFQGRLGCGNFKTLTQMLNVFEMSVRQVYVCHQISS